MNGSENGKKALIAMSGGVDSSVAAALMIRDGYTCIGCTMKLLNQPEGSLDVAGGMAGGGGNQKAAGSDPEARDGLQKAAGSDLETRDGLQGTAGPDMENGAGTADGSMGTEQVSNPHACCSLDDVEDARQVARRLHMPYYVFNFTSDFGEKVIDRFVKIYQAGGTPNPCIDCNRYMKFGLLYHRARVLGCEVVVTGHYARIRFDGKSGRWMLLRSRNPAKDQTYVLYSMTQDQLAHTLFPLGEFTDKEEVRALAEGYGFVNSNKPDSQDICFVQNGKYADFIERRTGRKAPHGDFVDEDGHVLGEHKGLIRYTIGQRKGLGLALPAPLYVSRIDTTKNQVVLTPEERLFSRRLIAEDFNWIWVPDSGTLEGEALPEGYEIAVTAKPRYRAKEAAATARVLAGGKVEILFHEPQRALTIGQAVVLYQGENVVGGGTICEVPRDDHCA